MTDGEESSTEDIIRALTPLVEQAAREFAGCYAESARDRTPAGRLRLARGLYVYTRKFSSTLGILEDYGLKVSSVDTASLQRKRLLGDALESYDAGIAAFPANAEALLERADLLLAQHLPGGPQPARAVDDATRALALALSQGLLHSDWVHRQYRWVLARAQIANRDWESAVRTLEATVPYANTRTSRARIDEALSRAANREDIDEFRI